MHYIWHQTFAFSFFSASYKSNLYKYNQLEFCNKQEVHILDR